MLTLQSDQTPFAQAGLSLRIGELDPMDAISGQYARLNNLGYAPGVTADAKAPSFLSAVRKFQCEHGLTVDGVVGPKTKAKLEQTHGC